MSKTDKTKPWRVRVAEHQPWADHDHRDGVCDLPDDPRTFIPWDKVPHCRWSDWNIALRQTCCSGCGCQTSMCSGKDWRAADNRKSRHKAKRDARRQVKAADWRE